MKKIILASIIFISAMAGATAQNFTPVIEDIVRSYIPWTNVEFQGKLSTPKLPITPTIKMYMVRDSLLQLSVRVPLLGEVGRLNWTKDEILIVNKMKRTYVSEDPSKLMQMYPTVIDDLQNIFLARVVILGDGPLSMENAAGVEVESVGDGNWILIPELESESIPFMYGYLVSANGRTAALTGALHDKGTLEIVFSYGNNGMSMDCTVDTGKKTIDANLSFSSVKWGGSEMALPNLNGYAKMSFKEFISNLK